MDTIPDYFIIYGEEYFRVTSAVEQVNLLQNKNALTQFFNSDIVSYIDIQWMPDVRRPLGVAI